MVEAQAPASCRDSVSGHRRIPSRHFATARPVLLAFAPWLRQPARSVWQQAAVAYGVSQVTNAGVHRRAAGRLAYHHDQGGYAAASAPEASAPGPQARRVRGPRPGASQDPVDDRAGPPAPPVSPRTACDRPHRPLSIAPRHAPPPKSAGHPQSPAALPAAAADDAPCAASDAGSSFAYCLAPCVRPVLRAPRCRPARAQSSRRSHHRSRSE